MGLLGLSSGGLADGGEFFNFRVHLDRGGQIAGLGVFDFEGVEGVEVFFVTWFHRLVARLLPGPKQPKFREFGLRHRPRGSNILRSEARNYL